MSILSQSLLELAGKVDGYSEALEYYEGRSPDVYANTRIARILKSNDAKFRINWCRSTVTAVSDRLEISRIATGDARADAFIQDAWDYNMLSLEALNINRAALVYGETYVIAWPNEEGNVVMHHNTPESVRVFYNPNNPRQKTHAIKTWVENKHTRVDVYFADRIERYISVKESQEVVLRDERSFVDYVDDDGDSTLPNPFGEVPVFHFRTSYPMAHPEHYEAYGIQNMLNKFVVAQMTGVDFNTFPQRYILWEAAKNEGGADADNYFDDEDEVTVGDSAGANALVSGPGTVWDLTGAKSVGEFASSDPGNTIEPMNNLMQQLSLVTNTPHYIFNTSGVAPSGESRRMAERPLVKKVEHRQLSLGATWKELFKFVLKVSNIDAVPQVTWAPVQDYKTTEDFELAEKKIAMGIPKEVVLGELGYTVEEMENWTASYGWNTGTADTLPVEEQ